MVFDIIKAETRTASFIGWFSGICGKATDFIVGSVVRSKFEAVAVEMESQDFAFYTALKKAIPTAIYNAFNFNLLPAVAASNSVIFTANTAPLTNVNIPAGTIVVSQTTADVQGNSYATASAATLIAGQTTVSVFVECTVPGAAGNTNINTINTIQTVVPGIDSVNNAVSFTNGQDIETETQRRARWLIYITTLARGINTAVEYGATSSFLTDTSGNITEQIAYANFVDAPSDQPAGSGTCYVCNSAGIVSDTLLALAQQNINGYTNSSGNKVPGWKAAGAKIAVTAATLINQNFTIVVTTDSTVNDWEAFEAQVQTVTENCLQGGIGGSYIYNEHVQKIMDLPGAIDVSITPVGNVNPASGAILRLGTATVTEP